MQQGELESIFTTDPWWLFARGAHQVPLTKLMAKGVLSPDHHVFYCSMCKKAARFSARGVYAFPPSRLNHQVHSP
jgi:hypothetical protein